MVSTEKASQRGMPSTFGTAGGEVSAVSNIDLSKNDQASSLDITKVRRRPFHKMARKGYKLGSISTRSGRRSADLQHHFQRSARIVTHSLEGFLASLELHP